MANSYNTITVQSNAATLILAANSYRCGVTLYNNSSVVVYIGTDESVASTTGMVLGVAGSYDFNGWKSYKGPIYGRAASSTADVRFLTWTE